MIARYCWISLTVDYSQGKLWKSEVVTFSHSPSLAPASSIPLFIPLTAVHFYVEKTDGIEKKYFNVSISVPNTDHDMGVDHGGDYTLMATSCLSP